MTDAARSLAACVTDGERRHGPLTVRRLGRQEYLPVWEAMKAFTAQRTEATADELWLLEHPPVFTQGLNGKPEHLLTPGDIPVIAVDRGGQVTYHGPGQILVYCLIDIHRAQLGPRGLITLLERSVVEQLAAYEVRAYARPHAPGVYVDGAKIASLGLRIRRGRSYHGLALNVDMDLEPFRRINPCGYPALRMTQLRDLGLALELWQVAEDLLACLTRNLGYTTIKTTNAIPDDAPLGATHARTACPQ